MCVSVTMSGEITSQALAAAASAQASSSTSSGDPGATNGQVMLHSFHVVVTLHAQRITDQCTSTVRSFAARPAAAAVKKNRRRDSSSVHGARCESPWARGFLSLSCVPLSHHPRGGGRRQHTVTLAGRVCGRATSAQRTFHADHRAEPSTAVRGAPRREQWRPLPRLLDRPAAAAAAAATRQDGDVDLRACFLSADAVVRHGRTALARLCASARRPRWRPGMPGIHPQAAPVAAAATIVRASGPGGRQHRRSAANCCCCRFSGRIGMI